MIKIDLNKLKFLVTKEIDSFGFVVGYKIEIQKIGLKKTTLNRFFENHAEEFLLTYKNIEFRCLLVNFIVKKNKTLGVVLQTTGRPVFLYDKN